MDELTMYKVIFGLYGTREKNQEQIAEQLGILTSQVRQATQRMGFKHGIRKKPYNPIVSKEELSFLKKN